MKSTGLWLVLTGAVSAAAAFGSAAAGEADLDSRLRAAIERHGLTPLSRPRRDPHPRIHLGMRLFHDPVLSGNRDTSCATCHQRVSSSADAMPLGIGTGARGVGRNRRQGSGRILLRNTPAVFNLGHDDEFPMFWDSRVSYSKKSRSFQTPEPGLNGYHPLHPQRRHPIARVLDSSLAAQAMFPPVSHDEMRGQPGENEIADAADNFEAWKRLTARVLKRSDYLEQLQRAYPDVKAPSDFNFGHIATAIAAFERHHFAAIDTPYDRYLRGDDGALTDRQKRGAVLFVNRGRCVECHAGALLSNGGTFGVAVPQIGTRELLERDDKGRAEVFQPPWDKERYLYAFRVPPLRNVGLTAPYMHNGAFTTLEDVVRHYSNPQRSFHSYRYAPERYASHYSEAMFADGDDARNASRIERIDHRLMPPPGFSDTEVAALTDFLENALTDPAWERAAEGG